MIPGAYSLVTRQQIEARNDAMSAHVFLRAVAAAARPTCSERIVYAVATELGKVSFSLRMYSRRRGIVKKMPT